ncbi:MULTISPECIES: hypothetical protein [unclassified Bradyrhizobium]|uniref:hypothetical protein n=1 Tax=unclassified Bradyrhizobium TaxID=2631580 RepID=UPI0024E0DDBB|nr:MULTISPECIES: hypothetical protein [unclassified Bradyrhizobium]
MEQRYIIVGPRPDLSASGWFASTALTGARFWTDPSLKEAELESAPVADPAKSFWSRIFGIGRQAADPAGPDPGLPFAIPPAGISRTALSQPEVLISWAGHSDALYPMQTVAEEPADSHKISIELSDDFVSPSTDSYAVAGDTLQLEGRCGCGTDLRYENSEFWFASERIRRVCPACGQAFRPQDHPVEIIDGLTCAKVVQPGGLCRRFAIRIHFGRFHPTLRQDANGELVPWKPLASEHFIRTCEMTLGFAFNEFENWG